MIKRQTVFTRASSQLDPLRHSRLRPQCCTITIAASKQQPASILYCFSRQFTSGRPSSTISYQAGTPLIRSFHTANKIMDQEDHFTQSRKAEETAQEDAEWKKKPPYRSAEKDEHFDKIWTATCSCRRIKYWLSREKPLAAKFCHCKDCQSLHGAPFQWAAVFKKEDLHFEKGADGLAFYNSGDKQTHRKLPCKVSCSYCHTPIMDEGRNAVIMFPGIIKVEDPEHKKYFEPQCHIFYSQRVVDIPDGKPKWKGLEDQSEQMEDVKPHELETVVSKRKLEDAN